VQVQEVPLELRPGESLKLRIFIDHSMLEVFANGKQCATQRIWPTLPDANRIRLFTESGEVHVPHVKAWNMAATTPD
jgi:beta-fructofuranosidase